MERVILKGGVSLSRLVYGMWRLADDPDVSPGHIRSKVAACLDQGITTMDHADIYGGYGVENLFGTALRGSGLRDRIEIVTKCGIIYPAGRHAAARLERPAFLRSAADQTPNARPQARRQSPGDGPHGCHRA